MNKGFRGWSRPRHKVYVSDPVAIDTTNGNTFRHGFGRAPGNVQVRLRCVTANNGYTVGREIPISLVYREAGAASSDGAPLHSWSVGDDTVFVRIAAANTALVTSAAAISGTFTPSQWRIVVRCADIERLV